MIYKYIFADGTETDVDVDEETYKILRQLDRKTRYNNTKNYALPFATEPAAKIDVVDEIRKAEQEEKELIRLELEEFGLTYSKKQLLKVLTEKQALAYFYHKYAKMKTAHIVKIMGITEGAVRKLIKKAEINLQNCDMENIKPDNAIKLMKAIFYSDMFFPEDI